MKIIIFGLLDTAELAHYYLQKDSTHEVVAFTAHEKYITDKLIRGLPVVPFEKIESIYSPKEYALFAPMTGRGMNRLREAVYLEGKRKGYQYISYVSSKAILFDNKIGENCFILEGNVIQPFTTIGNNVVLWSGNHIGHHSQIADHVFFSSHVVLSGHCRVDSYSFFGVNATIKDYIHITKGTLVGMSASVLKDTEEWGIYTGNPAMKKKNLKSTEVY